ncbi:MAG: ATP-binding cassette domain-containing protein [Oscillospiraceae bacterium]|nr:ATP-binding cassette domain-containing protein [Oscillospiraceae bacterium]
MQEKHLSQTAFFRPDAATAYAASALVTIFDGQSAPIEVDLSAFGKNAISFGRGEQNDIVIRSKLASRQHGYFKLVDGAWHVENNASSTNGLIVGGKKIDGKALADKDSIRIDNSVETSAAGVLIVFSVGGEIGWQTISPVGSAEITIGRGEGCDIKLEHISVSKLHAKICRKDEACFLLDNNSTNGVFINGKKVEGKCRLHEKDIIVITNSKIIFSTESISYRCYKGGISVEASNLAKRVADGKIICNGVNLNIEPGEVVAIVGGSGAGKSTVMNCLSGYSQPTSGSVLVNGVELYENFDALKNVIGYVPQADIVYDNLTVFDMLQYAAQLRLPRDISENERLRSINDVIKSVELVPNKETLIKNLSGGQRKRASIAVELLSDPNLFFLDEPASGLDPGIERNLMLTLKKMAEEGKTVVFVTHSTLNLHLCNKIAFMGKGGNLCFYGSYMEALGFFQVSDIVDAYSLISEEPERWKNKYNEDNKGSAPPAGASVTIRKSANKDWAMEIMVLCKRNLHIMANDRTRLLLIFAQAPLLALLISFVANGYQFYDFRMTRSLLFALSCSAFWVGILNSIQEICKERNIIKREYMAGLRLDSYIFSKLAVMAIVCAVQSIMIVTVFAVMVGLPRSGVLMGAYFEILGATFLTALSASALGIFISSLFKNADRAMTVAPLLLMPQLLFSGMIFELSGLTNVLSYAVICRWSMQSLGTTSNLNALYTITQDGLRAANEHSAFYTQTAAHLLSTWGALLFFAIMLSVCATLVLRNINSERRA